MSPLNGNGRYVPNLYLMPQSSPVLTDIVRSSYGYHLLDHLAADGAGFAGGQVTVVAVGQVHANLPWCLFYIVNVKLPRIVLKSPCFEGNFQGIQDAGTQ